MPEPSGLVLSPDEIYAITHYKLPKKQLAALLELGIPAHLRKIDHTVCVLRAHVTNPSAPAAPTSPAPQPAEFSARRRCRLILVLVLADPLQDLGGAVQGFAPAAALHR